MNEAHVFRSAAVVQRSRFNRGPPISE